MHDYRDDVALIANRLSQHVRNRLPRNAHPYGLARLLAAMIAAHVNGGDQSVAWVMLRAFGQYTCRPLRRAGGRYTPKQYLTAILATLIGMMANAFPQYTAAELAVAFGLTNARAVSRVLHLAQRNAARVQRKGIPRAVRTLPFLRVHGAYAAQWFLHPFMVRERADFWAQDLRTRRRSTS